MGDASQARLLILSGMHRSGTSHLAKIYHDAGMAFPGTLLPPNSDNPEGYWEAKECVSLNNEMLSFLGQSWKSITSIDTGALTALKTTFGKQAMECLADLRAQSPGDRFAVKDPRFCRLLPVWVEAASALDYSVQLHATYRNAEDVSRSLFRRTRDDRFLEAAIDTPSHALLLWLRYNLDLRYNSVGIPRAFTSFDDLRSMENVSVDFADPSPATSVSGAANVDHLTSRAVNAAMELFGADTERQFAGWRRNYERHVENDLACPTAARSARTLQRLNASANKPNTPIITFVSGAPHSKGHIYRIENRIFSLAGGEAIARRGNPELDDPSELATSSDLIVIFRRPMDPWQARLIDLAAKTNTPVVFDIDDLVFDQELVDPQHIRFLQKADAATISSWQSQATRYRETMEASDQVWLSTVSLAAHAARFNANVRCMPNGLTDHQLKKSRDRRPNDASDQLVIGYASGTPSHDKDLELVAPALKEVLAQNKNITLHMLGEFGPEALEEMMAVGDRVTHSPSVPYYGLSERLREFDINLAPLEIDNRFCQCKSELKFFEAAAVHVPTVMSPTEPFIACSNGGSTGLLAQTKDDWHNAVQSLVDDATRRTRLGMNAREYAVRTFGPARQKKEMLAAIAALLPGFSEDG